MKKNQANMKSPHDIKSKQQKQFSNCFMKPSLSMNALPPEGILENSELSPSRLRIDRPYNSLKKKRDCDKTIWRRSWESGHSHSSCSLQSSTTNALSGTGKDEFWAALQTNYNYIMDTNLLDSCREARGELEGVVTTELLIPDCCQKSIFQSSRSQGSPVGDPRRLRRWLRDMENRISKTPSLLEAMKLKSSELEKLIGQHSVLHREIVAQARSVARTTEKENFTEVQVENSSKDSSNDKNDEKTVSPTDSRRNEGGLKGLERRYHLLYLNALEVQIFLENILESHQSSQPSSRTDTDEEPAPKLARLSDAEFSQRYEDGNSSDNVWEDKLGNQILAESLLAQETGFEADTELSDNEEILKITTTFNNLEDLGALASRNPPIVLQNMEKEKCSLNKSGSLKTSSTSSLVISPKILDTVVKRPKKIDISKFNKSNRKSKNCAIFYFKHLDTDTENNNAVTGSEATKSDISSESEWFFTSANEQSKDLDSDGNHIIDCAINRPKSLNGRRLDFDMETTTDIVNGNVSTRYPCDFLENISNKNVNKRENVADAQNIVSRFNSSNMFSTESIQKLVSGAETLVLGDVLMKSPKHNKNIINELKMSATSSSSERPSNSKSTTKAGHSKIKKVQEWLEHQPDETLSSDLLLFVSTTDCEASGEYTDSDNAVSRDTDTSEEVTDSVATCLKGEMNSQGTSTEKLGDSAEVISTNEALCLSTITQKSKVLMRNFKRSSDRPWSVSCISQLTRISPEPDQCDGVLSPKKSHSHQQDVTNFSISESAINTLYHCPRSPKNAIRNSDSKNSLKRRRLRTKKRTDSKRYDSGSEDRIFFTKTNKSGLSKSESFSGKVNFGDDRNGAMTRSCHEQSTSSAKKDSSDERSTMMQPNFRIGEETKLYGMANSGTLNLGSLAALANYNKGHESKTIKDHSLVGTEENSSFSEQAWDSYQEKYMSEPYSEDRDMDAARRLLEFGDDYRNFLDSQSDNCSSLSAANIDSLSPPEHRKYIAASMRTAFSVTPESSLELRMRRVLELPKTERRRKNSGKSEERRRSWNINNDDSDGKKVDTNSNGRKFSESDTSSLRRRSARSGMILRSISHLMSTSSSSCSSNEISDDDVEVKNLLQKTKDRLDHTKVLRGHSHLLRPEDYKEIISTCRDNIQCLEAILTGPPGTVLSDARCQMTKDLLAAWENLSKWSENAAVASQLQEEMRLLKTSIERLGNKCTNLDTEAVIKEIIDELMNDKLQMQTYRSSMLTINATVHHWLTQQELNMNKITTESVEVRTRKITINEQGQQEVILSETEHINSEKGSQIDSYLYDANLHKQMKDEVGEMYAVWDETDEKIRSQLENLQASLIIWKQFENGLSEFQDTLDKDRGALSGLRGALETGETTTNELISNVQQVAKLLSEKIDNNIQCLQISSDNVVYLDPVTAALSSSDSGISDGDGGLSERERRLGALRRLAKQLENSLAPGSYALKTITNRMEAAEQELRLLQETCRELIIKTAVAQDPSLKNITIDSNTPINVQIPVITIKNRSKRSPPSKRKNKRRSPNNTLVKSSQKFYNLSTQNTSAQEIYDCDTDSKNDSDYSDLTGNSVDDKDEKNNYKKRWLSRIMSIAVPVQIAIITLFFATCLLEPHCCDSMNNFSNFYQFNLKYIKGPPPV